MKPLLALARCTAIFSTLLLINACKVVDKTDYAYLDSWDVHAITLQNRISQKAPLRLAEFPATHNSFNAQAYSNGISYPDPNHIPSMLDQLRMGKRMINMDLHWDIHFDPLTRLITTDVVLCHDSSDFGFCSMWDRTFDEGLIEIKEWLEANDEVVILKLQDELDGHYTEAFESIRDIIGDLVHRPVSSCNTLNLEQSKADILAAGKKLIIIGANASTCEKDWREYVFINEGVFGSVDYENFMPYPICNDKTDEISSRIYGSTNDGTIVAQLILNTQVMTASQVSNLATCGITAISFEPMEWWDERHRAQIWSWDENYPHESNTEKNCAIQRFNAKFQDTSCTDEYEFSCQHPQNRDWKTTLQTGTWEQGTRICSEEFGDQGYVFSTPVNGYENAQLNSVKFEHGITDVWLNYSDSKEEGLWVAR